jgi:hypothetical protein
MVGNPQLTNYIGAINDAAQSAQQLGDVATDARQAGFNAIAHIYGPDVAAAVHGAPQQYDAASTGVYRNALTGEAQANTANIQSETAERQALMPGAVKKQEADIGLVQAQTGEATANTGEIAARTKAVEAGLPFIAPEHQAQLDRAGVDLDNAKKTGQQLDLQIQSLQTQLKYADPMAKADLEAKLATVQQARAQATNDYQDAALRKQQGDQLKLQRTVGVGANILHQMDDMYQNGAAPEQVLQAYDRITGPVAKQYDIDPQQIASVRQAIAQGKDATHQLFQTYGGAASGVGMGVMTKDGQYISPQAIHDATEMYVRTGQMPALGMGDAQVRNAIINNAPGVRQELGIDVQGQIAGNQALKGRQKYVDSLNDTKPQSAGGQLVTAGTVADHLGLLTDLVTNLKNGQWRDANALRQEFQTHAGVAAPMTFQAQREFAIREFNRYFAAGVGNKEEQEQMRQALATSSSPQQLLSVMGALQKDIGAKLGNMRQQAQAANADDEFMRRLSPRARAMLPTQQAAGWKFEKVP